MVEKIVLTLCWALHYELNGRVLIAVSLFVVGT